MKRKCAAFVIASLFVFTMLGSARAQSDEEQLKKFETDRADAVVKGDIATVEKGTADDYTFANVYGQVMGKTQLLNALKSGDIKLTSDDVSDMKVRVYGNTAVITGKAATLAVNARDAMPNGGKLRIQTRNVRLEKDSAQAGAEQAWTKRPRRASSNHSSLRKQWAKEPGWAWRRSTEIVKQSNGHIEVQSTLGHGSSFRIYLPAAEPAGADHESGRETAEPVFSGETVLVVEDAEPLRNLICEALGVSGCTVLSAPNGREALRIVNGRKGAIDLLLTDVIMPGMNGPALAKQVRSLHPQTKILYMTGYSGEFLRADMLIPGVSFIQKPFTPADLRRKIRKLLADQPQETPRDATSSPQQTGVARKAASARSSG